MIPDALKSFLPFFAAGRVVRGFGRGGKKLGCPTANLSGSVVEKLPQSFPCGVYYGWATVDNGGVLGMVMSVGWNPQFKNTKESMEAHILHEFSEDFYGSLLKLMIVGYIRDMKSFSSLEELTKAIQDDIRIGKEQLGTDHAQALKFHEFFKAGGELKIEKVSIARSSTPTLSDSRNHGTTNITKSLV